MSRNNAAHRLHVLMLVDAHAKWVKILINHEEKSLTCWIRLYLHNFPSVLLSSALCRCGYWSASFLRAAWAQTINAFIGRFICGFLFSPLGPLVGMGTKLQSYPFSTWLTASCIPEYCSLLLVELLLLPSPPGISESESLSLSLPESTGELAAELGEEANIDWSTSVILLLKISQKCKVV